MAEDQFSLLAAGLMVAVGVGGMLICRQRWGTRLRLFGLGALLWAVSVAVKAAVALVTFEPAKGLLARALPGLPGDLALWGYGGLLTGLTECLIFLCLIPFWRRRTWRWQDAASVGMGFAAVEAALLGLGLAVAAAASQEVPASSLGEALLPAIERLITLPIHAACGAMAIYAIVSRRWGWFWAAFSYKSGVDAVATYVILAGTYLQHHRWLLELGVFGPWGVAGLVFLWLLWRQWKVLPPADRPSVEVGNG